MNRGNAVATWFRSPSNVIASVLVIGGFLLTALDWRWLALMGVGVFGPGVLRELGWLKDKDELEMQAARRAGYHAYLVGGLMLCLLMAFYRSSENPDGEPSQLVTAVFVIIWFTWLLSSLLSYWGARKMARRLLLAFGAVWLVFNIMAGEGDWMVSVMQSLLAVPFFVTAMLANRWPRAVGVVLVLVSAFLFRFLGFHEVFAEPFERGRAVAMVLFLGPLLASGIGLLFGELDGES